MAAISIVYWVVLVLWGFCGVGRNWPFTGPLITAAPDVLLLVLMLIVGIVVFPFHI